MSQSKRIETCRLTGSELLPVFDLGSPCVSDFLKPGEEGVPAPLCVAVAKEAPHLAQLTHSYPPEAMYRRYHYRSGTNEAMRAELADVVAKARRLRPVTDDETVLDIACNDGTLLRAWQPERLSRHDGFSWPNCVGIDPSDVAREAAWEATAIYDLANTFFTADAYRSLTNEPAAVVTCIACFYDLDAPVGFLKDVRAVMADDGLFVLQVAYIPMHLRMGAWDYVGHEHLAAYDFRSLAYALERAGLSIVDAEITCSNGGSIRVYATPEENYARLSGTVEGMAGAARRALLSWHETADTHGIGSPAYQWQSVEEAWRALAEKAAKDKKALLRFLNDAKAKGKTVVGLGACYDAFTRAVTPNGFKRWEDLEPGDEVITLNPETEQIEIKPIDGVMSFPYEGEMVRFSGKRIDLLVTPNHRMLLKSYKGQKPFFEPAEKTALRQLFKLPTGTWVGKDEPTFSIARFVDQGTFRLRARKIPETFETKDFLYLLGLFIGDGYICERDGGFSSNFCIPEQDKARKDLMGTLDRMKLSYRVYGCEVQVASKALTTIFADCGKGAANKRIPAWALEYAPQYLQCLLKGLVDSDGWYEGERKRIKTVSQDLVSGLIELCIKTGHYPSVSTHSPSKSFFKRIKNSEVVCRESYTVNIGSTEPWCYNEGRNDRVPYKGTVWCLSVENQNFLVERNGKIAFCGNSTKGNTILQFCGIGPDILPCIADRQEHKHGLVTVGSNIPIVSESEMRAMKPDYLLALPWFFADSLRSREADLIAGGTKLVLPLPKLTVLD